MKKGIIIILAVAIIGAIALYEKSNGSPHLVSPASTSSGSSAASSDSSSSQASTKGFKDGTYTGATENTPYGTVQVAAVVSGGKISDINFLQMPSDLGRSSEITSFSEPLLKHETLQKQSANLDFVSGATVTSSGYQQSLQAALDQAAMS